MSSQIYDDKIPQGWEVVKLGEISLIKTGSRNNQDKSSDGEFPFFVRSATVERINTYSYDCEAILIPGEGGIGSIYHYINGKFDAHQRVYVIRDFNKNIDAKFVFFALKEFFGKYALQNTVKATVDSLRLPTFQKFEFLIPSDKAEQERIAQVLGDMDELISDKCELLGKKRAIKQAAAQQLLTPKPHWHTATLGVCVEIITPPSKINTIEYSKSGKFPIIDQSQDFICGWTDDDKKVIKISEPIIIFGDHTCVTKFVNFDFAQGADGIKILKSKKFLNPKFLYQLLQFDPIVPEMYKRHFSKLKGKKILYPKDKAEQKMISQVLGDMDDEISALQDEIEKLKMIKQGAMDELLSGKIRLKG